MYVGQPGGKHSEYFSIVYISVSWEDSGGGQRRRKYRDLERPLQHD